MLRVPFFDSVKAHVPTTRLCEMCAISERCKLRSNQRVVHERGSCFAIASHDKTTQILRNQLHMSHDQHED